MEEQEELTKLEVYQEDMGVWYTVLTGTKDEVEAKHRWYLEVRPDLEDKLRIL